MTSMSEQSYIVAMDEPPLSDNAIDYTTVTFPHSIKDSGSAVTDNDGDDGSLTDIYADADVEFGFPGSCNDEECAEVPLLEESNHTGFGSRNLGSETPGEGPQRSRSDSFDVDIMTTRLMIHADEFFKKKDRSGFKRKKALLLRAGILILVLAIFGFAAQFFLGVDSPFYSDDMSADEVTEELTKCLDGRDGWLNRLKCGCYWNGRYHQCDAH